MTRTYAALRLLELGPLTFREFAEITGWPVKASRRIWKHLLYSCWISPVSRIGKCLIWGLNGLANTHHRAGSAFRQAGPAPRIPGLRMGQGQGNGSGSAGALRGTAGACQAGGKGEGQC